MSARFFISISGAFILLSLALAAYFSGGRGHDGPPSPLHLESFTPAQARPGEEFTAAIKGMGFSPGMRVALSYDFGNSHALIGRASSFGRLENLHVSGDYLFAVGNPRGLLVYDVKRPDTPEWVASLPLGEKTYDLALHEGLAYVLSVKGGLQIVDISSPRQPSLLSSFRPQAQCWGIALAGRRAYLACGKWGLQILDVGDPSRPELLGAVDTPGFAWSVSVGEGVAYVADGTGGVQIVDIADPIRPAIAASLTSVGNAHGIAFSEGRLYVKDFQNSELHLYDLSRPRSPRRLSSLKNLPGKRIRVSGSRIYLSALHEGVVVIDASRPRHPARIGTLDTDGSVRALDIVAQMAYVADGDQGVKILDLAEAAPRNFPLLLEVEGDIEGLGYDDGLLYSAAYSANLQVFSLDPEKAALVHEVEAGWRAEDVAVRGREAFFAAGEGGLIAVDLNQRETVYRLALPEPVDRVIVVGDLAVLRGAAEAVYLVDISSLRRPKLVGRFADAGDSHALAASASHLFLTDVYRGLLVVDITAPQAPRLVASVPVRPGIRVLAVQGDDLYVGGDAGLQVFDIVDPLRPELKYQREFSRSVKKIQVAADSQQAFFATSETLYVQTRGSAPRIVAEVSLPSTLTALILEKNSLGVLMKSPDTFHLYRYSEAALTRIADQEVSASMEGGAWMEGALLMHGNEGNVFYWEHAGAESAPVSLELPGMGLITIKFFALSGQRVYVVDSGNVLHVFNKSPRSGLARLGRLALPNNVMSLATRENLLYLGSPEAILIVDARDPEKMHQVGEIPVTGKVAGISVQPEWTAIAAGTGGLQFFDTRNPLAPRFMARLERPWPKGRFETAMDLAVAGHLVYVACGTEGLMIVDAADPAHPQILSTLELPGIVSRVQVRGERAFVGTHLNGLVVIDISDPRSPAVSGKLATRKALRDFLLHEDGVFLAEGRAGIPFLPLPIELTDSRLVDRQHLHLRIPPLQVPGRYTLQVFNGPFEASLPGALRVESPVKTGTPVPPRTDGPAHSSRAPDRDRSAR